MMTLKSFFLLALGCGVAFNAYAGTLTHENAVPKPVENNVYADMVGTWQGTCEMMGKKTREVMKVYWILNHQYLMVEIKATDVNQPKINYEGMGVFGVDKDGKAKTFWFDNWGVDAATTGSGTFGENTLELHNSNPLFKEVRTFEMKGNEIRMHAKGTVMSQGKEVPFDVTAIYKKKHRFDV